MRTISATSVPATVPEATTNPVDESLQEKKEAILPPKCLTKMDLVRRLRSDFSLLVSITLDDLATSDIRQCGIAPPNRYTITTSLCLVLSIAVMLLARPYFGNVVVDSKGSHHQYSYASSVYDAYMPTAVQKTLEQRAILPRIFEHEHVNLVTVLEPISSVDDFIRGYVRARIYCEEVAHALGWKGILETMPRSKHGFNDTRYLSAASLYSPYFCLNFPIALFLGSDPATSLRVHYSSSEGGANRWNAPVHPYAGALKTNWFRRVAGAARHVASGPDFLIDSILEAVFDPSKPEQLVQAFGNLVGHVLPSSGTFDVGASPLHNAALLGYQSEGCLVRATEQLGNRHYPRGGIHVLPYATFDDLMARFHDEQNEQTHADTVCLCGPHIGLARHIVVYLSPREPIRSFYLEPVILESSDSDNKGGSIDADSSFSPLQRVTTQALIWIPPSPHAMSSTKFIHRYQILDHEFRKRTDFHFMYARAAVIVDSMVLAYDTQDNLPKYLGQRRQKRVDGQEALCIQYCQHLAYAVMNQVQTVPSEEQQLN